MEFWEVEVKPGVPIKVKPDHGQWIHISQAALGEAVKDVKGAKNIPLRLKIDDKNFIIGFLKPGERTQLMFDLAFEKEFELSHDWKDGNVSFTGYLPAAKCPPVPLTFPRPIEFWGVEVKPGVPIKVKHDYGRLIHISQAALGEAVKDVKGAKNIPLRMKIDDKDFVLGFLKPEERTQLMFDLVFEKEFVLSHDWKNGSIFFMGYSSAVEDESSDSDDVSEDGSDDEDMALSLGGGSSDDLSGDDSEEDDSEEEEMPKNVQQSKKRPAVSAQAAPVFAKKAKSATPEKPGNKKGQNASGKNATGKMPLGDKSKQSPKSCGQFSGKSANMSFNSKAGKGGNW
ncbi:hypothetical protein CASFOL_030361 [Castilleja foliolosa]|uniref:Nucleoplasmin-like domain-containing protein n=1 Tax=Castilleja foliolosa TaxID=1961234 RepID=A0ABD3CAU8_9LAMI